MTELVFATNNPHKLAEARSIIGDRFRVVSLSEIGCHDDIPETAATLEGNALQKARYIRDKYGKFCFADDTGLFVDALGGLPGVHTARFAGDHCNPDDNIDLLLKRLEGKENRSAHFDTVIAFCGPDGDHTVTGSVSGTIATSRRGIEGFGYDPVFIPDETGISFAMMSADEKNAISHRGRALEKFIRLLDSKL